MRECEIDLVAEHGEAALIGFSSGTHISLSPPYPGVSCGRALTGKALLFLSSSLLIRGKADFEDDSGCDFSLL